MRSSGIVRRLDTPGYAGKGDYLSCGRPGQATSPQPETPVPTSAAVMLIAELHVFIDADRKSALKNVLITRDTSPARFTGFRRLDTSGTLGFLECGATLISAMA